MIAQVALQFNIQHGVMVITKTVHKNRMAEDIDIWNFELSIEDMEIIKKLDIGHSGITDHLNNRYC